MCGGRQILGVPGAVDAVYANEDFARAKTAGLHHIDNLVASDLLGFGCNRIFEIKNHAVDLQGLCFFQRASIGPRHIEHAAAWTDGHRKLSPSQNESLAPAPP